jgi:hypothetical protein
MNIVSLSYCHVHAKPSCGLEPLNYRDAQDDQEAVSKKKKQVKVKFSLERPMKAQRGSRGIALLFL